MYISQNIDVDIQMEVDEIFDELSEPEMERMLDLINGYMTKLGKNVYDDISMADQIIIDDFNEKFKEYKTNPNRKLRIILE